MIWIGGLVRVHGELLGNKSSRYMLFFLYSSDTTVVREGSTTGWLNPADPR
jgi:hypothetical protein